MVKPSKAPQIPLSQRMDGAEAEKTGSPRLPTLTFCKKPPQFPPIPNSSQPQSPFHLDPSLSSSRFSSGGGGWCAMADGAPPDPSGRGPPVPGGGRSSHAPQDAGTGASSPFAWQGGPPTGSLGALLAAAGAPPGVSAGAWRGFPTAGAWPFFSGAHVPAASAGPGAASAGPGSDGGSRGGIGGSRGGGPTLASLPTGAWPPSAAMAGGGTGPAVHGGLPDCFAGAATAALGSEWLHAYLGTPGGSTRASSSTTKEVPSQAFDVDK
jgi:hypothetical protein